MPFVEDNGGGDPKVLRQVVAANETAASSGGSASTNPKSTTTKKAAISREAETTTRRRVAGPSAQKHALQPRAVIARPRGQVSYASGFGHRAAVPVGARAATRPLQAKRAPSIRPTAAHPTAALTRPPSEWKSNAGRIDYAYHYFRKQLGLTPSETAALVGNMVHESYEPWLRGRPTLLAGAREGGQGGGIGIAQWTYPARKANLYAFTSRENKPWSNFGAQLRFERYELESRGVIPYYDPSRNRVVSHGGAGIAHDYYSLPDANVLTELKHERNQSLRALTRLIEFKYETPQPGSFGERLRDASRILEEEMKYGRIRDDATWRI